MAGAALAPTAAADPASLYRGPAPRPGPDILYEKPAVAPQLTNAGIWRAPPTLVSGTSAYRAGEFLYQDFLYDDHGADGGRRDPDDPRSSSDTFAAPAGTYTYPTAGAYAGNAADLVELRVRPLATETAFRLTLNTLKDPELVAATIAIGDSPLPRELPHGAGVRAPAARFLTVHGSSAELLDAASGQPLSPAPTASVDLERRQIDVRVPHAAWNPGSARVRLAAGIGLWDVAAGRYLVPRPAASETAPGGAGALPSPPAFFNVAFRFAEPFPVIDPSALADPRWWRDKAQADSLAAGDLAPFAATVDFGKLAEGGDDDLNGEPGGVPLDGPMDRILSSRFEPGQGIDYRERPCSSAERCDGQLGGRLQPYSIYVPRKPAPAGGYGLTLLLHSLSANHNQFHGTRHQQQFGERGRGSIVITPEGRGPDGWYYDVAGADTFEVWADVADRFRLDPDHTVIAGYSMGGYGTYKLATQFPDLFARGQPTVGPPGLGVWSGPPAEPLPGGKGSNTFYMLPSLRNIPFMMWVASADELVPLASAREQARGFDALGYRYVFDTFTPADHFTLAQHDQYQPAAEFLGEARVDRNPAHVTYVVNPTMDFPRAGTAADHAYWLSGLRLRDGSGDAPLGTIDVRSAGFGEGDPVAKPAQSGAGTLDGKQGTITYTRQSREWGPVPHEAKRDELTVTATNVASVTIAAARAKVTCSAALKVVSDGPIAIRLAGCDRAERFGAKVGCLVRRARVGSRNVGRVRLGDRRSRVRRRAGAPAVSGGSIYRYCVPGGGSVVAVFSPRGDARLIATTARGHRARRVAPGSSLARLRRAYPSARRAPIRGGRSAVYLTSRSSRIVFGVRARRVRFVAVADRRLVKSPRTLRAYLRRAGLR